MLDCAAKGATFLLNAPFPADQVWDQLPHEVQEQIVEKGLKFYAIDALKVAREAGMGGRINTVMQTCFFALTTVLPPDKAIQKIKSAIEKTYGKKGGGAVEKNFAARWTRRWKTCIRLPFHPSSLQLTACRQLFPPRRRSSSNASPPSCSPARAICCPSARSFPMAPGRPAPRAGRSGTSRSRSRCGRKICIQCNKCVLVCPHAAIRAKIYQPDQLSDSPPSFKSADYKAPDFKGVQIYAAGRARRLHGLQPVRERLPGQGSDQPPAQSDRHAPASAAPRRRAK